jgi:hypothetical protein
MFDLSSLSSPLSRPELFDRWYPSLIFCFLTGHCQSLITKGKTYTSKQQGSSSESLWQVSVHAKFLHDFRPIKLNLTVCVRWGIKGTTIVNTTSIFLTAWQPRCKASVSSYWSCRNTASYWHSSDFSDGAGSFGLVLPLVLLSLSNHEGVRKETPTNTMSTVSSQSETDGSLSEQSQAFKKPKPTPHAASSGTNEIQSTIQNSDRKLCMR